jgi:hypothetical protein
MKLTFVSSVGKSSEKHGWHCQVGLGRRLWQGLGHESTTSNPYRGFRFPAEIINQAVWLYHCFSLSLREVELILAARGIVVSYETIRAWSLRFGRVMPKPASGAGRNPATNGFRIRYLSASAANCTISGGRSTSTATCSMCWCRVAATRRPPSASFASCSRVCATCPE